MKATNFNLEMQTKKRSITYLNRQRRGRLNIRSIRFAALVTCGLSIALAACGLTRVRVGELRTDTQTVELEGTEPVDININISAGKLSITGGTDALMEAEFRYNFDELKPDVSISGSDLTVQHPETELGFTALWELDGFRNEWDLRLHETVPMDINISMGAGIADLAFGGLNATRVGIQAGAGEFRIDLSGNNSLRNLDLKAGTGRTELDLTGDWQSDVDVEIIAGVGDMTVTLPADLGVIVDIDVGLGNVDAFGLHREGGAYVNDAYGSSSVTVRVNIQGGVGDFTLRLGD
jgi:hypothetical protein